MNWLSLAPNIQEAVLFLPRVESGRDLVTERELREVVGTADRGAAGPVVVDCRT